MYAVETAKMSSKGQLVIPGALRKSYGWKAGMTLLLIGTGDSVVLQPLTLPSRESIEAVVRNSKKVAKSANDRIRKATRALSQLDELGISLPDGAERSASVWSRYAEKHA